MTTHKLVSEADIEKFDADIDTPLGFSLKPWFNSLESAPEVSGEAVAVRYRYVKQSKWQHAEPMEDSELLEYIKQQYPQFEIQTLFNAPQPDRTAQLETAIAERDEEIERLQSYEQGLNDVIAWMKERGLYWQGDHQQEGADFAAILTEHEQQVSAQSDRKLEADKARLVEALKWSLSQHDIEDWESEGAHMSGHCGKYAWAQRLIADMEAKG